MHTCMLAHAATFAPLQSVHSESDLYILHSEEIILNSKLNREYLTPLTEGEGEGEGWGRRSKSVGGVGERDIDG